MTSNSPCWICGAAADSREHIIKQSDIRRIFGRGPYPKGSRLVRIDDGNDKKKIIQSEDSTHIKYQPCLCYNCNSARSQPWDLAYDRFMDFIQVQSYTVQRTRKIDLGQVAPGGGAQLASNLYAYFVKSFGCKMAEHGQGPPIELREFLLGERNRTELVLSFAVYVNVPKDMPAMVQIYDLRGDVDDDTGRPLNYTWAVSVEWLTFIFWYHQQVTIGLGRALERDVQSNQDRHIP